MSTIAELSLSGEEFALGTTLAAVQGVAVEVERVVASEPDAIMPYVWFYAEQGDLTGLEDALREDPSVEGVDRLSNLGDERLYRMHWVEDVALVVHALTEEGATILEATGERSRWRLRVLFPEREALSRTYDVAEARGREVTVEKIHDLDEDVDHGGRYGLTEAQHETLVQALCQGYYEIPRGMDMEELSNVLDISHQALSERLRRAHRTLVEEAINVDPADEDVLDVPDG